MHVIVSVSDLDWKNSALYAISKIFGQLVHSFLKIRVTKQRLHDMWSYGIIKCHIIQWILSLKQVTLWLTTKSGSQRFRMVFIYILLVKISWNHLPRDQEFRNLIPKGFCHVFWSNIGNALQSQTDMNRVSCIQIIFDTLIDQVD